MVTVHYTVQAKPVEIRTYLAEGIMEYNDEIELNEEVFSEFDCLEDIEEYIAGEDELADKLNYEYYIQVTVTEIDADDCDDRIEEIEDEIGELENELETLNKIVELRDSI